MATENDLDKVIEQYQHSLDEFAKGNSELAMKLWSHREDVTLNYPFGPPARGWEQVYQSAERAASQFSDGEIVGFERVAKYVTPELAYIVEVERSQTKVGGGEDLSPIALRVTSIFRPEEGTWKVVHRHADPITTPQSAESVIQE